MCAVVRVPACVAVRRCSGGGGFGGGAFRAKRARVFATNRGARLSKGVGAPHCDFS